MKILTLIICFISLLSCDAINLSKSSTGKEDIPTEKPSTTNSYKKVNTTTYPNEKLKTTSKTNFSTQNILNNLKKSDDTRKLVYLLHPTEEIIVYCYQTEIRMLY